MKKYKLISTFSNINVALCSILLSFCAGLLEMSSPCFKKRLKSAVSLKLVVSSILLFLSWQVKSIPVTPCNCSTHITIGTSGITTNYSTLFGGIVSNTCYFLRGRLNIDGGIVNWNQVRLEMEEGSEIYITSGELNISDSYISSCDDEMWKGIHAATPPSTPNIYTTLVTTGSIIQGAEFGIFLNNRVGFECYDVDFVNNYIGIAVGNPFAGDVFDKKISQKGMITGCNFYTDPYLPDPYSGFYYSSWPTTPTEIPYNQGFAAVFISGTTGFNLGAEGALTTKRNKIYQMRNGIIIRNANANIAGTDFYDFEGNIAQNLSDPLLDLNQNAINTYRTSSTIVDNTIDNVMVGVNTLQSMSLIKDNIFDIPTGVTNPITTRGITSLLPQRHTVIDNTIYNGHKGILFTDVYNPFEIERNFLYRDITYGRHAGIEINSLRYVNNEIGLVKDNLVDIEDGHAATGINLFLVDKIRVDGNDIVYSENSGAGIANAGITMNGGGNCMFPFNDITASIGYISEADKNNGMIVSMSHSNWLFCNDIINYYTLLRIVGPNVATNLLTNVFYDGGIGLELAGPTMIGTQEHHGNQWAEDQADYGAYISGPDPVNTAKLSKFIADESDHDPGILIPSVIGPLAVGNDEWFKDEDGEGPECEPIPPSPAPNEDSLVVMIRTPLSFSDYNDEMTWMMKADLFDIILSYPGLTTNTVLDSFFNAESTTPLGKLISWQADLNSRFGVLKTTKENAQEFIISLSEDVVYIDSVLSTNPLNPSTWKSLRALKVDTLSDQLNSWIALIDDEYVESMDKYEDIADSLHNLTTTNSLEANLKQVLKYKAQYLLGQGLSGSDSTAIVNLWESCPWEGGRAVSIAQGLYSIISDSTISWTSYTCTPPSPYIGSHNQIDELQYNELVLFPNPVIDRITVKSKDIIRKIFVSGIAMDALVDYTPNNTEFSFNMKDYPSGSYFLTIITDTGNQARIINLIK